MIERRAQSATFAQLAGELIASGKGFRFQARGRSMLPSIEDGDVLHVAPARPARLKIGDIVLFKKDGEFKAHRIVGRDKDRSKKGFITRGDASMQTDGMVPRESIIGRVVAVESKQGRLVSTTTVSARVRFFAGELRRRLPACSLMPFFLCALIVLGDSAANAAVSVDNSATVQQTLLSGNGSHTLAPVPITVGATANLLVVGVSFNNNG